MDAETELVAERNAFERIWARGPDVDIRTPLGTLLFSINEKFEVLQHRLGLADSDKQMLQTVARQLPEPQYKNAAALIYAYTVAREGRISKTQLARVAATLDFDVQLGDVVRYARLLNSQY